MFFFEKKNQKTFVPFGLRRCPHRAWAVRITCADPPPGRKSLLLLFFRKEGLA
jgi:hypothetical protein